MEQAIKKAIEGGYERGNELLLKDEWYGYGYKLSLNSCLLDPLFWQTLGKAMDKDFAQSHSPDYVSFDKWNWKVEWHHFIDHLAQGGDADSFFKDLLKV